VYDIEHRPGGKERFVRRHLLHAGPLPDGLRCHRDNTGRCGQTQGKSEYMGIIINHMVALYKLSFADE